MQLVMDLSTATYGWRCANCKHDWSMHGIRNKRGRAAANPAVVWCQEPRCRCRIQLPNEPAPAPASADRTYLNPGGGSGPDPTGVRLCEVEGCVLPAGHEPFGQWQHLYPGDVGAVQ